jgi:hypothetical protein
MSQDEGDITDEGVGDEGGDVQADGEAKDAGGDEGGEKVEADEAASEKPADTPEKASAGKPAAGKPADTPEKAAEKEAAKFAKNFVKGNKSSAAPGGSGSSPGSDGDTEAANNIMCKGFQELFTKNQAKYNEFLFRSLENYFTEGHTKSMLDKMLNKNMGEYIKSNQFGGIVQSEIKNAIGSVMQSTLKSELRNRRNYSGMCNEIDKLNAKRRGGGTMKAKRQVPIRKRRTIKSLKKKV